LFDYLVSQYFFTFFNSQNIYRLETKYYTFKCQYLRSHILVNDKIVTTGNNPFKCNIYVFIYNQEMNDEANIQTC